MAALSPIVARYQIGHRQLPVQPDTRKVGAAWVQDDWMVNARLTLNLGLRYDVAIGVWAKDGDRAVVEAGPSRRHEQHRAARSASRSA